MKALNRRNARRWLVDNVYAPPNAVGPASQLLRTTKGQLQEYILLKKYNNFSTM